MLSEYDSRIAAFKRLVEEAKGLCHQFNAAEHDGLIADDSTARLADPDKGDDLEHLRRLRADLGDIAVLRSRHAAAKLRIQLHLGKGRTIKRAAVDAVREILLSAAGGEAFLKSCSIGPLRPALSR